MHYVRAVFLLFYYGTFVTASNILSSASKKRSDDLLPRSGYQVHLSLGAIPNTYTVTWLTPQPLLPKAQLFLDAPDIDRKTINGTTEIFIDNGTLHRTQYVHRAMTPPLSPGSTVSYRVSVDNNGTSSIELTFVTVDALATSARFTIYGDLGLTNPVAFPQLVQEQKQRRADVILHVGDFAYDDYVDNATWGDRWFNFVEPVYSAQPVMTCPGNHEGMYNFLNYRKRFSMPMREVSENLYFSFDFGPLCVLGVLQHLRCISSDDDIDEIEVYDATTGHGGVHRNFGPYPKTAARQLDVVEQDDDDCVQMRDKSMEGWTRRSVLSL